MKYLILITILGIMLFTGCESEDDDFSAVIGFDNVQAKDSVYTNEDFVLTGTVTSSEQIKTIRFYRNYFFNDQEMEEEMAGTMISDITESPYHFSIVVPNIIKNTTVKVVATGMNGKEESMIFSIKERKMNVVYYSKLNIGGWDSMFGSCLDVDTGTPYGSSALNDDEKRPLIDLFFDRSTLACVDLDSIYYNNVNRLPDTGLRFAETSFTAAQFDDLKGDDLFVSMSATLKEIEVEVGDIVFFEAKSGKKGLLKVVSISSPTEDIVLEEKIQQ